MKKTFYGLVFIIFIFSCNDFQPIDPSQKEYRELVPCPDCNVQIELNSLILQGKYINIKNKGTIFFGKNRKHEGIKKFTNYMIELDYSKEDVFPNENIVTLFGPTTEYWSWQFNGDTLLLAPFIFNNKDMFYDRKGKTLTLVKFKE